MIKTHGLTHINLAVRDPDRSLRFYTRVFGVKEYYRDSESIQVLGPGPHDVIAFEKKESDAGKTGGLTHFGFRLVNPVVSYTSNKETKDFIVKEALKIAPNLKRKPGARYRLNRWREAQIDKGIKITYADLVNQYVKLNQFEGSFPQAPSGRYINFISDF